MCPEPSVIGDESASEHSRSYGWKQVYRKQLCIDDTLNYPQAVSGRQGNSSDIRIKRFTGAWLYVLARSAVQGFEPGGS